MKKAFTFLVCALALTLMPAVARAETTEPLDPPAEPLGVTLTLPEELTPYAYRLTDDYLISRLSLKMKESITIEPQGAAQTVVLNWYDVPASYTVTQLDASGAVLTEETITDKQLGRQISLSEGCKKVTVLFNENGSLGGVLAYPIGASLPDNVFSFDPAPAQADLLIISAEPGTEFRQFGAVLPSYTKEKGISTAMMFISDYSKRVRAYEALSGLQSAGYTQYPLFCGYESDDYSSYKYTASKFDRRAFVEYLKEQIKAINPKIIVTHAVADASGAHSLVAECVKIAVVECPSVQKLYCFGAEEGSSPTVLDMNAQLNAYGGMTAAEVSQRAYDRHASQQLYGMAIDTTSAYTLAYSTVGEDVAKNDLLEHIDTATLLSYSVATPSPAPLPEATQAAAQVEKPQSGQLQTKIEPTTASKPSEDGIFTLPVLFVFAVGSMLSVVFFALLYKSIKSTRGKGDAVCLCLLPFALCFAASAVVAGSSIEALPTPQVENTVQITPLPAETPQPSALPALSAIPEATMAPALDPDAQYYRAVGEPEEVIVADKQSGRWEYRNDYLGITIDRVSAKNSAGKPLTYFVADIHMRDISQFRPAFGAEGHTGRGAIHPWLIARREKAVLWMTGDNLVNDEREQKGILIRDGRMFWSGEKEDTLAIYPDMSMRIIKKNEMSPGMLFEDGVENAYSFGPTLIDNGIINEKAKFHRVRRANPRAGIGYLSPGHYIAIVVDGRQKDYSVGMPVWEFADLFATYGCSIAYNLDGGLSAAMIFMGEQINTHSGKRTGASNDISYQRAVPDGLMFGYSEQVPSVEAPVLNDGNHGN